MLSNKIESIELEEALKALIKKIQNAYDGITFDRSIYCRDLGYSVVCNIEDISETMPLYEDGDHYIQVGLNIAYNHGFSDALDMIISSLHILSEMWGVD